MKSMGANGAAPGARAPTDIWAELKKIQRNIDTAEAYKERFNRLKGEVMSSVDQHRVANEVKSLSDAIKKDMTGIIRDLVALKKTPGAAGAPARQIENTQNRAKKLQEDLRSRERELDNAVMNQMRAQLRIAKPELDEEAIADAVPDSQTQNIFAQHIMQSDRQGKANTVLGAVKARSEALAKIAQTFSELTELFTEMEAQVLQQGEIIEAVDVKIEDTKQDVDQGVTHLAKGVETARSTRKKKWWCLGISGECHHTNRQ